MKRTNSAKGKVMKQEQVKAHFARQADEYEELMVRIIPNYLEQNKIIYDLIPEVAKEYRVLDLGCGNGILTDLVFRKHPKAFVVGFDLTENMLTEFKKKIAGHTGKFELIQGDFRTDSIGEGYDIILAGLTLHHLTLEEREKIYYKLYSALNQNGIFISRDIIVDENQDIAQEQYSYWKKFMQSQGENPEFWYEKHLEKDYPITLTDHFAWLKNAGFFQTGCQWRLYNFAITTARK